VAVNLLVSERLRGRLKAALTARLSAERTRRATLFERMTVQRLRWDQVVRLNRYLEPFGKLTTALRVVFVGTVLLGVDWKGVVEDAVNSGTPVKGASSCDRRADACLRGRTPARRLRTVAASAGPVAPRRGADRGAGFGVG